MGHCKIKVGDVFSRLTVVKKTEKRDSSGSVIWKCKCECGNETFVKSSTLTSGHTKSCGCYAVEISKKRMEEHSRNYLSMKKPKQITRNNVYIKNDYVVMICSGKEVFLNIEDYNKFSNERWYVANGYCTNSKYETLHRKIIQAKKGQIVDHINGNRLDNRKQNLRFVTKSQNGQNRKVKGVFHDKKRNKWNAHIMVEGKSYYLGRYNTEEDAIIARKNAEIKYQGEYRYNGN